MGAVCRPGWVTSTGGFGRRSTHNFCRRYARQHSRHGGCCPRAPTTKLFYPPTAEALPTTNRPYYSRRCLRKHRHRRVVVSTVKCSRSRGRTRVRLAAAACRRPEGKPRKTGARIACDDAGWCRIRRHPPCNHRLSQTRCFLAHAPHDHALEGWKVGRKYGLLGRVPWHQAEQRHASRA